MISAKVSTQTNGGAMMRHPTAATLTVLMITLVMFLALTGCDDDGTGQASAALEATATPTRKPIPAPEDLALVYDVKYGDETTQWTIAVVREETVDGSDCYVTDASIEGSPHRRRLQGEVEVTLEPLSETYWRDKESYDPIRSESSVTAYGTLQVNTPRTFTYTSFHGIPLSIGKTWSYDVLAKPSMGAQSTANWNAEVVTTEEITVPAGTFDCYRVEHTRLAVNDVPEASPTVGVIEWWSVDDLFLSPVKIVDMSTYAQTETRELESFAEARHPTETPGPSDAERLTTGQAWDEFCDSLKATGEIVLDPTVRVTDQDQAEGYRHLLRLLWVAMNELMENNDPLHPYLTRYPNVPTKIGHDNPDNAYVGGPIRGDQTYRLSGTMGTNIFTSFNVYSGFIGFDPYEDLRTVSSLNSKEMEINPDGSFEIILSPDPHPGNWLKLEPDAKILVVRKLFYDWGNETEGSLEITNLAAEGTSSEPLAPGKMARQLDDMARFVDSVASFFVGAHYAKFTSGDIPVNTIPPPKVGEMAMADPYNRTQWGHFKLQDGEALMAEFPATDCLYTNFELGNMWWESLDYRTRQTHLNGAMS
jgi:hypothetical protein